MSVLFYPESIRILGSDANGNNVMLCEMAVDDIANLPAANAFVNDGYVLSMGCTAIVINDNSKHRLNGGGTWVQIVAGTSTYTQTEIDTMLSDKWGYTRPTIGGTGDFNIIISHGYYRYNGAPANAPTGATGEFGVLMVYTAGTYISQVVHCFLTSQYGIYIRSSTNTGNTWTTWHKLESN